MTGNIVVGQLKRLIHLVQKNFLHELIACLSGSLIDKELADSLSNLLDLALFEIRIQLDLLGGSLGDNLHKDSELVSILALNIGENVNQSLSLSEILLNLISGQLELVKRSRHSVSLNIFNGDLKLLGNVIDVKFVFLDVSQTNLEHSSLQELLDLLCSGWLLDWSPPDLFDGADGLGRHDLEPLLLLEGMLVLVLLLVVLLVDLLVLSFGHRW